VDDQTNGSQSGSLLKQLRVHSMVATAMPSDLTVSAPSTPPSWVADLFSTDYDYCLLRGWGDLTYLEGAANECEVIREALGGRQVMPGRWRTDCPVCESEDLIYEDFEDCRKDSPPRPSLRIRCLAGCNSDDRGFHNLADAIARRIVDRHYFGEDPAAPDFWGFAPRLAAVLLDADGHISEFCGGDRITDFDAVREVLKGQEIATGRWQAACPQCPGRVVYEHARWKEPWCPWEVQPYSYDTVFLTCLGACSHRELCDAVLPLLEPAAAALTHRRAEEREQLIIDERDRAAQERDRLLLAECASALDAMPDKPATGSCPSVSPPSLVVSSPASRC
jgi:hypothetical protein